MKLARSIPLIAATGIGALYGWVSVQFWGFYAVNNPINNWLVDTLAKNGNETAYLISVYSHDLLINTLLAIPVAGLIVLLKPTNIIAPVILALSAAITVGFWGSFWPGIVTLLGSWSFWVSNLLFAVALPLAAVLVVTFKGQRNAT